MNAPPPPPREVRYPLRKEQRDKMRALDLCINAPMPEGVRKAGALRPRVQHGPVVRGGKCQRCIDVHTPPDRPRRQP